jgi:hypothetical protein
MGNQILRWTRAVIHRLASKIKEGTKFFIAHEDNTNSHENREPVGEIISSYVDTIGGKLSNVIIGHFPEQEKVKEMDVCSVEAELQVTDEDNSFVGDVTDVTGVALGNSEKEHPAFPGALRLGAVQCFENKPGEGEKEMAEQITFQMVVDAVKKMNIHPRQLFTLADLQDDREFGKEFEKISTLEAENERLKVENADISKKSQESVKLSQTATAENRLMEKLKEGFTDVQKTFIKKQFRPEKMEDLSDEALDTFVVDAKKDFAETAKLFGGVKDETPKTKESNDSSDDDLLSTEELEKEALKAMGITQE